MMTGRDQLEALASARSFLSSVEALAYLSLAGIWVVCIASLAAMAIGYGAGPASDWFVASFLVVYAAVVVSSCAMAMLGVVTLLGWRGKPGTEIRFYSSKTNHQRAAGAITRRSYWQFLRDPSVLAIIAQGILCLLILAGCLVINLSPVKGSQAQTERVFSVLFVSIFGVMSTVCFINIPVTALRVWKKIRTLKQGIEELEATINSNFYSDFHSEDLEGN